MNLISFPEQRSRVLFLCILVFLFSSKTYSQRYLADLDSSFFIKDTVRPFIKRFENIRITGYMQPQFQVAQADGVASYEGGNFSQFSRSRFMLRRARIKIDYLLMTKERTPKALLDNTLCPLFLPGKWESVAGSIWRARMKFT